MQQAPMMQASMGQKTPMQQFHTQQVPMAPQPPFHPSWAAPRKPVFERISHPTSSRSEHPNRLDEAPKTKKVRQVYQVKKGDSGAEISESIEGKERLTSSDVIEIGAGKTPIKELGKRPIVIGDSANKNDGSTIFREEHMTNNHEASTSKQGRDPKYLQPR